MDSHSGIYASERVEGSRGHIESLGTTHGTLRALKQRNVRCQEYLNARSMYNTSLFGCA